MKKVKNNGLLSIRIDNNNELKVVFKPVNGNIWMNRNELCELFGCYLKETDESLETIFKKEMFRVEDTCKYHIIAGGKRVSYDITEVNLTVIIALAFLMTTPQARTLRTWFIEQLLNMKSLDIPFVNIRQNFLLN
jgi:hypothetical protein